MDELAALEQENQSVGLELATTIEAAGHFTIE
jgi:hypothetical protein